MDGIDVRREGGVVTVTLDRPEKKNAIDTWMFDSLRDTFERIADNVDDRAVILTGAGGAFSSGGDLDPQRPTGDDTLTMMRRIGRAAVALHECPKPVIAAVDGVAVGAGLSLVLGCDLVVATTRARFSMLFVHNGLALDMGGSWLLPRRLGWWRAAQLALLGDWVDATEAERIGLVNRLVEPDQLEATAADWARRLAGSSPTAVQAIKRLLGEAERRTLPDALEAEAEAQAVCARSPELRAAIEARRR